MPTRMVVLASPSGSSDATPTTDISEIYLDPNNSTIVVDLVPTSLGVPSNKGLLLNVNPNTSRASRTPASSSEPPSGSRIGCGVAGCDFVGGGD